MNEVICYKCGKIIVQGTNEVNELSDRVNDFGDRVSSFRRDVKKTFDSSQDKLEFAKYIINKNKGDQYGEDIR